MRKKITIEEFMKQHQMKKKDFASFLGISHPRLSGCLNQGKTFPKKAKAILEANNIEYENYERELKSSKDQDIDFENYFEKGLVTDFCHSKEGCGEYHCYSERQVNFITTYFNKKKVAYYSFFKDYYWVVKFDRNEDFEVVYEGVQNSG